MFDFLKIYLNVNVQNKYLNFEEKRERWQGRKFSKHEFAFKRKESFVKNISIQVKYIYQDIFAQFYKIFIDFLPPTFKAQAPD